MWTLRTQLVESCIGSGSRKLNSPLCSCIVFTESSSPNESWPSAPCVMFNIKLLLLKEQSCSTPGDAEHSNRTFADVQWDTSWLWKCYKYVGWSNLSWEEPGTHIPPVLRTTCDLRVDLQLSDQWNSETKEVRWELRWNERANPMLLVSRGHFCFGNASFNL